jgi:hypothetical protein
MKRCYQCILALAITTTTACETDDVGGPIPPISSTQVLLTDAPFPFDLVERVDVHIVRVAATESADTTSTAFQWIEIAEPNTTFNLLDLQRGTTALVGDGELPAGQYQAIRLVIDTDQSSVAMNDGTEASVRWPVSGELALHALVEEALAVGSEGASIVIDFDVGRSFYYGETTDTLNTNAYDFVFIPWIRAVNEAATGGVTGTVYGTDIEGNPTPLHNATVSALRGNRTTDPSHWWTVATGATDTDGTFKIGFLLEGEYIVRASPPSGVILATAEATGVEVTVGEETDIALTLTNAFPSTLAISGPTDVNVGEAIQLRAIVVDQAGDTLSGQSASWFVGPQSIITIEDPNGGAPTGEYATITGVSRGVGSVVVTSLDLQDSVDVTVHDPNAQPVETVELTPPTQTVAVFDSLDIGVTLRDALGATVLGSSVTWSTSDSSALMLISQSTVVASSAPTYAHFLALKTGTITVTATSEGKSGNATVVIQ